jgi:hypothetical protein
VVKSLVVSLPCPRLPYDASEDQAFPEQVASLLESWLSCRSHRLQLSMRAPGDDRDRSPTNILRLAPQ